MNLKRAYQWNEVLESDDDIKVTCGRKRYLMSVSSKLLPPTFTVSAVDTGQRLGSDLMAIKVPNFSPTNPRKCLESAVDNINFDSIDPIRLKKKIKKFYVERSVEKNVFCFLQVFNEQTKQTSYYSCIRRWCSYQGDYKYDVHLADESFLQYLAMHKQAGKTLKMRVGDSAHMERLKGTFESIDDRDFKKRIVYRLRSKDAEEFFVREVENDIERYFEYLSYNCNNI